MSSFYELIFSLPVWQNGRPGGTFFNQVGTVIHTVVANRDLFTVQELLVRTYINRNLKFHG